MVVYYIKKEGESLADYRYPIKEGDICMLYDGEVIKTVYIDSELDPNSIWRDFKFIDTKSLKSYQFPTSDSILCAPVGNNHAIGDASLLTQLIKECKGEWLLDFLNDTSAVLSGFVDYWDLGILSRFIGENNLDVTYENEETLIEFIAKPEEKEHIDEYDDEEDILPKRNEVKLFCLSALVCLEGQMSNRNYQILYDTLNGVSRSEIASKYNLTQERIRQLVVKSAKRAKDLIIEQRTSLDNTKTENTKLKAQLNLLREDIDRLKQQIPLDVLDSQEDEQVVVNGEILILLETPLKDIRLSVRALNSLKSMGITRFVDIPRIKDEMQIYKVKNSGRKTVHDISQLLDDFNLSFGMSYRNIIDELKGYDWSLAKSKWINFERKDNLNEGRNHQSYENIIAELNDTGVVDDVIGKDNKMLEEIDTSLDLKLPSGDRKGLPWTKEEEELITKYYQEGEDFEKIAAIVGRTEVAVKSRLGKLGLIDYTYMPEETTPKHDDSLDVLVTFGDFQIVNNNNNCRVYNQFSEEIYHDNGNMICIRDRLYHVIFDDKGLYVALMDVANDRISKGVICMNARPYSDIYVALKSKYDYIKYIEDINYIPFFGKSKIKYNGIWYRYDGNINFESS